MKSIFVMVLGAALAMGIASSADGQVVVSAGGRPVVAAGQPYGYRSYAPGYGANAYRPAAPYGSGGYTASGYRPSYATPYAAGTTNYYNRAYSGSGYAPSYGAYAPYGGYATPTYGYNRGVGVRPPGGYRVYGR